MIKIGITGIIGSGKSIVSNILQILGVAVYNADENAKILMLNNSKIKDKLTEAFGKEVYINNKLNKAFLSNKIFNSENDRKLVNSIVHPIVIEDFAEWCDRQNSDVVAIESALLFEAKINEFIDYSIEVKSPEYMLISRIQHRDNISADEAQKRIKVQKNTENNNIPDFVINNNEKDSVIEQTINILKNIKEREK